MAIRIKDLNGVCVFYRQSTRAIVLFSAVFYQRSLSHETPLKQIVTAVLRTFNLDLTPDSAIREYNRTLKFYLSGCGARHELSGIPAIFRHNAVSLMHFAATFHQINNGGNIETVLPEVVAFFGIISDSEAAKKDFERIKKAYNG